MTSVSQHAHSKLFRTRMGNTTTFIAWRHLTSLIMTTANRWYATTRSESAARMTSTGNASDTEDFAGLVVATLIFQWIATQWRTEWTGFSWLKTGSIKAGNISTRWVSANCEGLHKDSSTIRMKEQSKTSKDVCCGWGCGGWWTAHSHLAVRTLCL